MTTMHEDRLIVCVGRGESHSVATTQIHHRDFPELHAEGESVSEAGIQLSNLLSRELESLESDFHRDSIRQAIEDVKSFLTQHN